MNVRGSNVGTRDGTTGGNKGNKRKEIEAIKRLLS